MAALQSLQKELVTLVSEVTGLSPNRISSADRLREDLGLDSFIAMELLVLMEQKYKIRISESDLMKDRTLEDWVKLIAQRSRETKRPTHT